MSTMSDPQITEPEASPPPETVDVDQPWRVLNEALETGDSERLEAIFEELSTSDGLRALLAFNAEKRERVLTLISAETAAELIEEAPNEQAVELVENLDVENAADIIEALDSDVQADVIGDLDAPDAEAILAEMEPEEAADVRRLIIYDDHTAGGLMVAETFSFDVTNTVGTVLRRITSDDDEDYEEYHGQSPYIVDANGRLIGVVSLRKLLLAKRLTPLRDIMVSPLSVPTSASIDEIEDLLDEHEFHGVPVVDVDERLVGFVSRAALDEAIFERAESDNLKRQGVGDEIRSMPLWLRSRRRLAWLSANIVLNILAASVISAYEETLAAVIAIAIFLPMVSDMSGCSGNQAVAVSLRELALGLTKPVDVLRVWLKEVSVGVINGLVLGTLIALVAWAWKGNMYLGLVIGLALAINTVISVSIGGVVPLLLKRINQDPAVASGPLLTTITDMAGFFIVLSLATAMMPLLV
jgi:magnesium transporter